MIRKLREDNAVKTDSDATRSRLRRWGFLLLGVGCVVAFIFFLAPLLRDSVPALDRTARMSEELGVDPEALIYSEMELSYDSEIYVKGAVELGASDHSGLTLPLAASVFLSLVVLVLGYKLLPP